MFKAFIKTQYVGINIILDQQKNILIQKCGLIPAVKVVFSKGAFNLTIQLLQNAYSNLLNKTVYVSLLSHPNGDI